MNAQRCPGSGFFTQAALALSSSVSARMAKAGSNMAQLRAFSMTACTESGTPLFHEEASRSEFFCLCHWMLTMSASCWKTDPPRPAISSASVSPCAGADAGSASLNCCQPKLTRFSTSGTEGRAARMTGSQRGSMPFTQSSKRDS